MNEQLNQNLEINNLNNQTDLMNNNNQFLPLNISQKVLKIIKNKMVWNYFLIPSFFLTFLAPTIYLSIIYTIFRDNYTSIIPLILETIGWSIIALYGLSKFIQLLILQKRLKIIRDSGDSHQQKKTIVKLFIYFKKNTYKIKWAFVGFTLYCGLFLGLFWWLQNVNWWVFYFKDWINQITNNNSQMWNWIFLNIFITIELLWIFYLINGYKKTAIIRDNVEHSVLSFSDLDYIKTKYNRRYRRIFVFSILIIIVLPIIIIWILFKKLVKK